MPAQAIVIGVNSRVVIFTIVSLSFKLHLNGRIDIIYYNDHKDL